jgi:hypothetical protein
VLKEFLHTCRGRWTTSQLAMTMAQADLKQEMSQWPKSNPAWAKPNSHITGRPTVCAEAHSARCVALADFGLSCFS